MFDKQDLATNTGLTATARIIQTISRGIHTGRLKVGDKLPSRMELAKQLGVNATTVGHAYRQLEAKGILDSRRGSGTFVCSSDSSLIQIRHQRQLTSLRMVIGDASLADSQYNFLRVVVDLMAGLREELGNTIPIDFVESFDRVCLDDLATDSAVLLVRCKKVEPEMLVELRQREIPVLTAWNDIPNLATPTVGYNPLEAVRLAVDHLIACGYQRIGYIGVMGGRSGRTDIAPKFLAFTNTLFRASLDYQVRHVRDVETMLPGAAGQAVMDIIGKGNLPDAFFVDTDEKAMEVMAALRNAGLKVPEDIGVMGYNDIPEASLCNPSLSTVHLPRLEAGVLVGQLLKRWQQGEDDLPSRMLAPTLVVRESTAPFNVNTQSMPDQNTLQDVRHSS